RSHAHHHRESAMSRRRHAKRCLRCGNMFESKRIDALTCSSKCRQAKRYKATKHNKAAIAVRAHTPKRLLRRTINCATCGALAVARSNSHRFCDSCRDENRRAVDAAYQRRPEIRERNLAYSRRPDAREWRRAYRQRPEIRERTRKWERLRYATDLATRER